MESPSARQPLPELEMLSAWFDRSAPRIDGVVPRALDDQAPPRLLLILAPPRAGSFHVARLLWQLGYGKPTEYFNRNPLYRSLLSRWGERPRWQRRLLRWQGDRLWIHQRWLARLVQERWSTSVLTGTPFFSSKLQPFQLPGTFAQIWPRLQRNLRDAGCLSQGSSSVVLLLRHNWRAGVASLHLSRCTGAYDLGLTPTFQHLPLAALLDPEALAQTAGLYHRHLRWLLEATRVVHPLVIHHEDLVADQPRTLWRLLQHCDPELADAPWPQDPSDTLRETLAVPIARDRSAWAQERRQWLERIMGLLHQLCDRGEIALAEDQPLVQWLQDAAGGQAPGR